MNKTEDIIGTKIGIYEVIYQCDYKTNDGHKLYHVKCLECGFETDMKKADIKVSKKCNHINKLTNEQFESWYEKNKKQCLNCGKDIPFSNIITEYKIRKFCCRSCAASYNNIGINRYKDKPKKEKTSKIKQSNKPKKEKTSKINKKRQGRKCKLCGKTIPQKNKSGYCGDCYKKMKEEEKIKKWKETGETGTKAGSMIRGCIRRYIYQKQDNKCAICGMKNTWNEKELHFVLDHIDGDASNNWESNLRLICPNCDSQLDTFKSKNKHSVRNYRRKYK